MKAERTPVPAALLFALLAVMLVVVGCGGEETTTTSLSVQTTEGLPAPALAGTIAFTNHVGKDDDDICIVNTDGTGFVTVAGGEGIQTYPRWSPDGTQIAWTGYTKLHSIMDDQAERAAIFVMDADGTDVHSITSAEGFGIDWWPVWATDGKIYFTRLMSDGGPPERTRAFRVNADGGGLEELRTIGNDVTYYVTYMASPDGSRAAFCDVATDPLAIVAASTDGTGNSVTVLGPVSDYLGSAVAIVGWSPDGNALAVAGTVGRTRSPASYTPLLIVNADGTGLSAVPRIQKAGDPAWRPQ